MDANEELGDIAPQLRSYKERGGMHASVLSSIHFKSAQNEFWFSGDEKAQLGN